MYRCILYFFFCSISCYSQFYTGVAIDPNKAFGIIDNPRTEEDHRGLHFDIEAGLIENEFAFYVLFGKFQQANYQKLAFGTDYFFLKDDRIEMGVGISVSNIWKKQGDNSETKTYFGWLGRLTGIFWINPKLGLVGHFQYQSRPDLEVTGIVEGKIGLRYFFRN
ncbi:hypothetical protein [Salinimicrobium sediminilitoris]|uniref:hypothetical protein n=1 Tax=Salinimicrobium sediminilitoris TaxID=2876715 RepID=UPI001E4AC991|nr:hypothetical protein [Salinimicrobium sediminilitoris]MCC8360666.1 hypothetical protein [Salinimicrobium sediminilitoris]